MVTNQLCYSPVSLPAVFTLVHLICVELSCVLNVVTEDEEVLASRHVSSSALRLQRAVHSLGSTVGHAVCCQHPAAHARLPALSNGVRMLF